MGTLSKLRRLVLREHISQREAARMLGLSRNTVKKYLDQPEMREPSYSKRAGGPSILDPYKEQLETWLKADSHRGKRDRRSDLALFQAIRALGYSGSRGPVQVFCKKWREESNTPRRAGFIPLHFELGEAFQFDWSTEYAFIGGLRRRLEVAHMKLAASRAFALVAYYSQAHEMLFDAHAKCFDILGGVPRRGIYDNMKTAVDKVGAGKQRSINARFQTMVGHYLFKEEFCNRAAGWEKGIVEKNVQDRRRHIWREASERRWKNLGELNDWLSDTCKAAWQELRHPEGKQLTVAELWQEERLRLMPCPAPFDGYIEQPARVTTTSLIHFQRNRYSVPCEWINQVVSLRAYPDRLLVVGPHGECVTLVRSFERDLTFYDWRHYISLLERKPGALRNGAPFRDMPEPLLELQRQLLKHAGGDRVMVQVLVAVTLHGLEAVLVAVELALQSGRVSADHVLNVLARLKEEAVPVPPLEIQHVALAEPPKADVHRYDRLRQESDHVQ